MKELGRKYKDKITGFEGVATGYVRYLTGCNQVLLAPAVDSTGALRDPQWFDEQRLDVIDDEPVTLNNGDSPGFDRPAPKR